MKKITKSEKILNTLENHNTISTARISYLIKSNYIVTLGLLEDLLKQNKVRRIQHAKGVFWELK
jgi:hypothetical protein